MSNEKQDFSVEDIKEEIIEVEQIIEVKPIFENEQILEYDYALFQD